MNVTDRFLRYVKFDTQSDELTNLTPSTPGQYKFAQALEKELQELGLQEITPDENGYLILPILPDGETARLTGFLAENRLGILRLEERQKSLEDIFLELTGKAASL